MFNLSLGPGRSRNWFGLGIGPGRPLTDRDARAAHYRRRSEQVHAIAKVTADAAARNTLMAVAADYDMLARAMENTYMPDPIPASE